MCARTINGSKQFSYWWSGTLSFLECSSMLNASPVTNAFLGYTWLSRSFFSDVFFSTSWLDFYFTRFLIMYWWKRTPCVVVVVIKSLQGNEDMWSKPSKWILFKISFCWAKKWIEYLIFHFFFTYYESQKNNIFENVLEFRQQICPWNVLIV